MKKIYLSILFCIALVSFSNAQYLTRSFSYDGVTRQYILYVPTGYTGAESLPFVIALHGLGDNMNNFKNINFKSVADTAKFLVAFPQALVDQLTGSTAWNSGAGAFGFTLNSTVNDVGFLNALIDTVSANYNIDQERLYATGFSMGGFMSNRLACELNNRIAAIASVSGTIGSGLACQPTRAIPVAHFHGTVDGTVAYTGNQYGNDAEDLVQYWSAHDACTQTAVIDSLPDTKADGKTVIKYTYPNGAYGSEVELFKIAGGDHEWLTAANDITYTVEIWRFFSRFKWEEQVSGVREELMTNVSVFPNPANDFIHVSLGSLPSARIQVYNTLGAVLFDQVSNGVSAISLQNQPAGSYVVRVSTADAFTSYRLIKQ